MNVVIVFWFIYGVAGLFGFQRVPEKYKGRGWTKEYARQSGVSWILLSVFWMGAVVLTETYGIGRTGRLLLLLAGAVPGLLYTVKTERKYEKRLKEEQEPKE